MALICSAGARSFSPLPRSLPPPVSVSRRGIALVVFARKGISSRTNKGKKGGITGTKPIEEVLEREEDASTGTDGGGDLLGTDGVSSELKPMPKLPGLTASFWEGSKWDAFGFVVQYLWAFGIVFALIACGIAVATYNEGATDFKETTVYKESVQTQDFLDETDSSSSDVFEVNPTEVAPSLE